MTGVDDLLADSTDATQSMGEEGGHRQRQGNVLDELDRRARDDASPARRHRRRAETPPTPTTPPPATSAAADGAAVPEGMLQRAALDLELWMRQEQARFEERLEAKEKAVLKALSEEWRGRLREREALLQRKVAVYADLEKQLRGGLRDLQTRETHVTEREEKVERRERALQDEHARALADMRDASRRMEQDFEYQVELLERKAQARDEELSAARRDRARAEERAEQLQTEVDALRRAQAAGPNAQLQARCVELSAKVSELERHLAHTRKAKAQYKQEWTKALQTLSRQREKEQLSAKEHLRREQRELEHMRLQYLAQEERQLASNERSQLEALKRQVTQLKSVVSQQERQGIQAPRTWGYTSQAPPDMSEAGQGQAPQDATRGAGGQLQPSQQQELARLMQERQSLLNAGIYSPDDAVIRQLDARISTLLPSAMAAQ
jgi:centrosomal protein CEP120